MKKLTIILLFILSKSLVFADCSSSGIWAFPQTGNIKQNSLIVLTGYYNSQKIISQLNKKYPVYLESKGHKVTLTTRYTYKGMFNLTQIILKPDEKLISGKTYKLKIKNLDKFESKLLKKWNSELQKYESISWKVEKGLDTIQPSFISYPKLINKTTTYFGCGPAIYSIFKFETKDENEILIKTQLVDLDNGQSNIYFLKFDKSNKLNIGHGMCSGAFMYKKNRKYKVRFQLMDICGNKNNEWTNWTEFNSPFEEYKK